MGKKQPKVTLKSGIRSLDRLYRELHAFQEECKVKVAEDPASKIKVKTELVKFVTENSKKATEIGNLLPPIKIDVSTGLHYPSLGTSGKEKFRVQLKRTYIANLDIEAGSKEEAEQAARQMYFDCQVKMTRTSRVVGANADFKIVNPTTKVVWSGKWLKQLQEWEDERSIWLQTMRENEEKDKRWQQKKAIITEYREKKRACIEKHKNCQTSDRVGQTGSVPAEKEDAK